VHHGNGTEDLIECLKAPGKLFKRNNKNIIFGTTYQEKRIYKPWLNEEDPKNILFISTHLYNQQPSNSFYPSSGTKIKNTKSDEEDVYPGGILNVPYNAHSSSFVWRNEYLTKVFPRLIEFKPDFILISAGFDAHERDFINGSMSNVSEMDYFWVTKNLQRLANSFCEGRLVSVLEGGYNTVGGG
jgi:acetoin utilization deacetylase AcuC-like enzyme